MKMLHVVVIAGIMSLLMTTLSKTRQDTEIDVERTNDLVNKAVEYGVRYGNECYMSGHGVEFCVKEAIGQLNIREGANAN